MALAQLDRNVAFTRYAALRLEVNSLVASVDLLHFEYVRFASHSEFMLTSRMRLSTELRLCTLASQPIDKSRFM